MSNSLLRTFDKNPWKFASRHCGRKKCIFKRRWKKKGKSGSKNLKKQSIPDTLSKINWNILVTITLKGQGLTLCCKAL